MANIPSTKRNVPKTLKNKQNKQINKQINKQTNKHAIQSKVYDFNKRVSHVVLLYCSGCPDFTSEVDTKDRSLKRVE